MKTLFIKMSTVALSTFFVLSSCVNRDEGLFSNELEIEEHIVRERDTLVPFVEIDKSEIYEDEVKTRSSVKENKEYLGYGYNPITIPLSDISNTTFPIIDFNKIAPLDKDYDFTNSKYVGSWTSDIKVFSDFRAYYKSNNDSKISTYGFSLKDIPLLGGILGLGAEKRYKETFNTVKTDTSKTVYGELNILYRDSIHSINLDETSIKDLTRFYSKRFKKQLYLGNMNDIIRNYGYFIIRNVESGANFTALYNGDFSSNVLYKEKIKTMKDTIFSTFKLASKAGGDLNFGYNKGNKDVENTSKKRMSTYVSIRSYGGDLSSSHFSTPVNIKDISNIDFKGWNNSLKDKRKLTISQIGYNGLTPISDIFIEENLKQRAKNIITKNKNKVSIIEPYIYLEAVHNMNKKEVIVRVFLVNKFQDIITLKKTTLNNIGYSTYPGLSDFFDDMLKEEKNFFRGIKIKSKHINTYLDDNDDETIDRSIKENEAFLYNSVDSNELEYEIYACEENDNLYIISHAKKIAFTVALKQIWRQYGFKKAPNINDLPTISLHELIGYTFFAL